MSIALFLKENLKRIPPHFGQIINRIPFNLRPGIAKVYHQRKKEIDLLANSDILSKQDFVLKRIRELVEHSYNHIPFYRELYDSHNFDPSKMNSFSDIQHVPIITKSMLNEYEIEERSFPTKDRYIVNTGGSSGTPFSFYIEPSSMGHEWAHMHTIWEQLGYKCSDFKLVFGGRSDVRNLVEYDVLRNSFAVDIYANYNAVAERLKKIIKKHKIKYLHGYPSSIYDFALFCESKDRELKELLSQNLEGAFLGSEYPHKSYRDKIEAVFDIKTISWYGHTERAGLAYERDKHFTYFPFLSYGFSEADKNSEGDYNLISTSYYNYASPLIRYNTEDVIENPKMEDGILDSFEILKGRSGEFVIDRDDKKVNLTGLIFGRHHELFNHSDFLQVRQISKGHIELLFVSKRKLENAEALFDTNNLNFAVTFKQIDEPVRTAAGKINLKVE